MPQQTSYGYSGYHTVPANQPTNVAMYALGGAVVGAGAMYAYNNMYGDAYGDHRRRRIYPFNNADFCIVTAAGSRNGDFMECLQCRRLYGNGLSLLRCKAIAFRGISSICLMELLSEASPCVRRPVHLRHLQGAAIRPLHP